MPTKTKMKKQIPDYIRRGALIELASRDFTTYCRLLYPAHYKPTRPHLLQICNEFQEFIESDNQVLILNAPPRHYKSFSSVALCQWVIGRWPAKKVMSGSYNETLSETFSKSVRNAIDTVKADPNIVTYSDIFPGIKIKRGDGAVNHWALEGQHATYLATSPTGTATGFGCDLMIIDDLIKSALEANNATVLEKHWLWFCFTGDTIVSTPDGNKKISDIRIGDKVYSFNHSQCIIEEGRIKKVQSKQAPIYNLRLNNGTEIEVTGNHQFYTNSGYKSVTEILHNLWGEIAPGETVLFTSVQEQSTREQTADCEMPELPEGHKHRACKPPETVLFYGMPASIQVEEFEPEIRDVAAYSRGTESEIQRMPEMSFRKGFACSSHRPRFTQQRAVKPDSSLPIVPYWLSQATRLPSSDVRTVYDIEVEGNHNFFANGILVHNCNTMLSRLEEGGKIIIVMTRWHSQDLAGRALRHFTEIGWKVRHVSYQALQEDGSMLCPELLSHESYLAKTRTMGADIASANYQQIPIDIKGKLYTGFKTYDNLPVDSKGASLLTAVRAYIDTADEGSDFLCCIVYGVYAHEAYVIDVIYTQDAMEKTEPAVADMLTRHRADQAVIESNNGGRGFARNIERLLQVRRNFFTCIKWFHQSQNKTARILTNATWVMEHIYFPANWRDRWPAFYASLTTYQQNGKNAHDDAEDAITGIAERMNKKGPDIGAITVRS